MTVPTIRVENLGKLYQIGERDSYRTLRNTIVRSFQRSHRKSEEHIWALRDVSFDVYEGEVVGCIGGNGAGKSTLLKLLSRITEPTEGSFELRGRVSSLLDIGVGFHPELTGRENIFLSGAILGMRAAASIVMGGIFEAVAVEHAFVGAFVKLRGVNGGVEDFAGDVHGVGRGSALQGVDGEVEKDLDEVGAVDLEFDVLGHGLDFQAVAALAGMDVEQFAQIVQNLVDADPRRRRCPAGA